MSNDVYSCIPAQTCRSSLVLDAFNPSSPVPESAGHSGRLHHAWPEYVIGSRIMFDAGSPAHTLNGIKSEQSDGESCQGTCSLASVYVLNTLLAMSHSALANALVALLRLSIKDSF